MKTKTTRLRFEQLENRWAMAGAVLVDVSGNNIKITGDDQENDIEIFVDGNNQLQIVSGPNATTVNIKPGDVLPAGNALGKLDIDFKKALIPTLNPPDARGALGVDTVNIHDLNLGSSLKIKGKNGCVVHIESVFARQTVIDFDAGNGLRDIVNGIPLGCLVEILDSNLGNKGGPSSPFKGGVAIATKDCRDHVFVEDSGLEGTVSIKTKGAIDEIGFVNSFIHASSFEAKKQFTLDSGKGDDAIMALGLAVNGKTKIVTSDGADQLLIGGFFNNFVGTFSVDTGKGDDTIGVGRANPGGPASATFQSKITLKAGNDNDKLMLGNAVVVQQIKHLIDGGKQTTADVLEVLNPPFDPNLTDVFKNWETRGGFVPANLTALENAVGALFP